MKPQVTPADLDRLLAEEAMLGESHAIGFLREVIGEEGLDRIVEWCADWSYQMLGPEEGSTQSTITGKQIVSAMSAMGIGMFELGWKAHIQYGGGDNAANQIAPNEGGE